MLVINCFSFWLIRLSLEAVISDALTQNYILIKDSNCDHLPLMEKRLHRLETSPSSLDCARRCVRHADCEYVRTLSLFNGSNWCERFFFNRSFVHLPLQSIQHSDISSLGLMQTCYKCVLKPNSENQSHWSITNASSDQEYGTKYDYTKRLAFIDTKNRKTQTTAHIAEFEDKHLDAKTVFQDEYGVHYAIVATWNDSPSLRFKTFTVYAMETRVDGFTQNASRIVYVMTYTGTLHSVFAGQNGSSWRISTKLPDMQMYIPTVSEYSLIADVKKKDVPTLISWVRQGCKAIDFTHANVWDDETGVSFYFLDNYPFMVAKDRPGLPLKFRHRVEASFEYSQVSLSHFGKGRPLSSIKTYDPNDIAFSPEWRSAVDSTIQMNQKEAVLKSLMFKGHKFRMSYNDSFFDVNDVLKIGNEMYFFLPPKAKGFPRKLAANSIRLKAVLSLGGNYFWCSHPFEGETVLDSGFETDQMYQYFVDQKTWISLLSVHSNGIVASGSVSEVADAALHGADVNVLIEWLTNDNARLLSVIKVSVHDYRTPSVLVAAESVVTWHFDDVSRELDSQCDMEKVLIKSNGDVQVLVYNIYRREMVTHLTNVKSTWFVV